MFAAEERDGSQLIVSPIKEFDCNVVIVKKEHGYHHPSPSIKHKREAGKKKKKWNLTCIVMEPLTVRRPERLVGASEQPCVNDDGDGDGDALNRVNTYACVLLNGGGEDISTTTKTLVSISVRASLLLGCRTWLVYVRHNYKHQHNQVRERERMWWDRTSLSATMVYTQSSL